MGFKQWFKHWLTAAGPTVPKPSPRPCRLRPALERLEDRSLPSSFTAAGVVPLAADSAHSVVALAMKFKHDVPSGSADGGSGGSTGGL